MRRGSCGFPECCRCSDPAASREIWREVQLRAVFGAVFRLIQWFAGAAVVHLWNLRYEIHSAQAAGSVLMAGLHAGLTETGHQHPLLELLEEDFWRLLCQYRRVAHFRQLHDNPFASRRTLLRSRSHICSVCSSRANFPRLSTDFYFKPLLLEAHEIRVLLEFTTARYDHFPSLSHSTLGNGSRSRIFASSTLSAKPLSIHPPPHSYHKSVYIIASFVTRSITSL